MARFTAKERMSIMLSAWRKLGKMKVRDATDKRLFMENCIDQLTNDGQDEDDARDTCELIWEEGDTSEYE